MADERPLRAVTESSALILAEEQDEKARQAYEMRQDGASWYTIAKALNMSESAVRRSLDKSMEMAAAYVSTEAKRRLLALEVDRLDRLQAVIWPNAMQGNMRAISQVVQIIMARAKVLGLDAIPDTVVTNNTLVVTGDSEAYVAALRTIAGQNG